MDWRSAMDCDSSDVTMDFESNRGKHDTDINTHGQWLGWWAKAWKDGVDKKGSSRMACSVQKRGLWGGHRGDGLARKGIPY